LSYPNSQDVHQFRNTILSVSGEDVSKCIQCGKCSAGRPISPEMDLQPNQVLRLIQMNDEKTVLQCSTLWLCASCQTCSVRCPDNIDIAKIMDTLRHMAIHSKVSPGEKDIPLFHSVFLDEIKSKGRIHELSLILKFKLKTKDFLKDAGLGWKMFRLGKIKLLPSTFSGGKEIKEIFNLFEKGEKR